MRELGQHRVAGALGLQRQCDRGLRRAGLQAVLAGQLQNGFATGELLEAAGVVPADVADERRTGQGQERDLAGCLPNAWPKLT